MATMNVTNASIETTFEFQSIHGHKESIDPFTIGIIIIAVIIILGCGSIMYVLKCRKKVESRDRSYQYKYCHATTASTHTELPNAVEMIFVHNNNETWPITMSPVILDDEKSNVISHKHSNNIEKSIEFQRLTRIINSYQENETNIINDTDIKLLLNDFLHLLEHKNNISEFQFIYNQLGGDCDGNKCYMFLRNYRKEQRTEIKQQIADKIHCFYRHTFDIGYRLRLYESPISTSTDQMSSNELVNINILKMSEILSEKHKKCHKLNEQITLKFNQIYHNEMDSKYGFGTQFKYGYKNEDKYTIYNDEKEWIEPDAIKVYAKYSSLKEELTNNKISVIDIKEFSNEYSKAEIHFATDFRKEMYPNIEMEYILSLMIYCNFTEFQNKFSQTYYKNVTDHDVFYHLAKNIKISIHEFGTEIRHSDIKSFYHGIGEKLVFPNIFHHGTGINGRGINIYCPLSTSSSFPVAMNFTNMNNGLIIEFGDENGYCQCKYFHVSWLSDFVNESEYLFIQNMDTLQINNIFDAQYGFEYGVILKSLRILDKIINGFIINKNIDEIILSLINGMISNKLKMNASKQSTKYEDKIIDTYFNNKTWIQMDYQYKKKYSSIFEQLFHDKYEWIDMNKINKLFPNIESIRIENVNISEATMDDIISCLQNENHSIKLKSIMIEANTDSDLDMTFVTNKYQELFEKLDFRITIQNTSSNVVCIEHF